MADMLTEAELRKLRGSNERGHWRDPAMNTERVWRETLMLDGHIPFVLDGIEYFIVPIGKHAYGLNTWEEYKSNGGWEKWSFKSEDELLNAKLFNGRSILERLDDILLHEMGT